MKISINPAAKPSKKSLSRLLATTLLITGSLALLSAAATFAFHVILPIATLLALGTIIVRCALHKHSDKTESMTLDIGRFSLETASEAAKIAGEFARSSTVIFHHNPESVRETAGNN